MFVTDINCTSAYRRTKPPREADSVKAETTKLIVPPRSSFRLGLVCGQIAIIITILTFVFMIIYHKHHHDHYDPHHYHYRRRQYSSHYVCRILPVRPSLGFIRSAMFLTDQSTLDLTAVQ